MRFWIFILVLFFVVSLFADNIYLKNGVVIKNVKITAQDSAWVYFEMDIGSSKVSVKNIEKIEKTPYLPGQKSSLENQKIPKMNTNKTESVPKIRKKYPNLQLLPLTLFFYVVAYDEIKNIDYINDLIEIYKKLGMETDKLEAQKKRKYAIFYIAILAGTFNLSYSLKRVEIRQEGPLLSLKYHF